MSLRISQDILEDHKDKKSSGRMCEKAGRGQSRKILLKPCPHIHEVKIRDD